MIAIAEASLSTESDPVGDDCDTVTPRAGAETVVDKVRKVLETVAYHGPLGLSALAREAGLSKTTVHRLTGELLVWGVVERSEGRFVLGRRMADLGQLVTSRESLREIGHPFAVELFAQFRLPVTLSVRQGLDVRCVAKISGTVDEATGWMGVGTRAPLHCTAAGKAILAFSPPELFAAVVSRPMRGVTPFSTVAPAKLALQLRDVRRTGYSVVRQEVHIGASSIGVPMIDRHGRVAGAFAMPLPKRAEQAAELQRCIKQQAARLAAQLP
ncbi:IclR family transcriptional regulator [Pseudonocardia sp. NPDC049635]|uniref:IclR family transcriptional regulator n=1 Tax=Pseudonocardia sp. NPDC049635 TaxID=3155506 RepID=UPI00340BC794